MYILRFLVYYLLNYQILYIGLTVNQQFIRIPVTAYPCLHWVLKVFNFSILVGMQWYLAEVVTCFSWWLTFFYVPYHVIWMRQLIFPVNLSEFESHWIHISGGCLGVCFLRCFTEEGMLSLNVGDTMLWAGISDWWDSKLSNINHLSFSASQLTLWMQCHLLVPYSTCSMLWWTFTPQSLSQNNSFLL